ncbi:MAG: hypothetical protein NWE88_04760 [Candidatus Bathyarchaeota archaeon]|nr:hypothetical protein [Candidatus Bathyarchaeota archaeon]
MFNVISFSLNNVQATLLGSFLGASTPILMFFIRDWNEERTIKTNIKSALKAELEIIAQIIEKIRKQGAVNNDFYYVNNEVIQGEIPFDTPYYDDVTVESLAKTFITVQLSKLQKVYRNIDFFNRTRRRVINGTHFQKDVVEELETALEELIAELS